MSNTFTVPWKRPGTSNLKYTLLKKHNGVNDYISVEVNYTKNKKPQHMVAHVIDAIAKPKQYAKALTLVGKEYDTLPSLM